MEATRFLESQHRQVEQLFAMIEKAPVGEKRKLFDEIADALAIHATIEEKIFYPAAKMEKTEDLLLEAVEEHLSAKRVIADLLDMSPADESFDAKVTVLKELIAHHVKEEETELFPMVRRAMGGELDDVGAQLEAMSAELLAKGNARAAIPAETAEAAAI
jgi:hemerythrin-like domain-containing protein